MKKTFPLTASNKVTERHLDSVKHEINKYVARERRKKVPEGFDFIDFDCKFGDSEQDAEVIHLTEINAKIMGASAEKKESCYIEILAKPSVRTRK